MTKVVNRYVHLDEHLSPLIKVGEKFDKKKFQEKLVESAVEKITVFAKCHHGYVYFPTKVGKQAPSLEFDLLGEQIKAAHEVGVKADIYITFGWSVYDFENHPEYWARNYGTETIQDNFYNFHAKKDERIPAGCWVNLCPNGEYGELLKAFTKEVCERYKPVDGIFFDICFNGNGTCACETCKKKMKEEGLDGSQRDAEEYWRRHRRSLMSELNAIIKESSPNAEIFYNGSAFVAIGNRSSVPYHEFDTYYYVEELPTLEGNYDKSCFKVKYFERYGKPIIGGTGKFHRGWGEFGGYKTVDSLIYEAGYGLSLGIGTDIGDQMHPSGKLDDETYNLIGTTFRFMKEIEPYCFPTKTICNIALCESENQEENESASYMLSELHQDYCILTEHLNLQGIKYVIIPSETIMYPWLQQKLDVFMQNGGKVIALGNAPEKINIAGLTYIGKSTCDVDYLVAPAVIKAPAVVYRSAHKVKADGFRPLAEVYEPYFNRTYEHYCSHEHTPYNEEKLGYSAAYTNGKILYIAHDLFVEYNKEGGVYLRKYLEYLLREFGFEYMIQTKNFPVTGRIRLRKNVEKELFTLHVLYAPIYFRGRAYLIDDIPTLYDVEVVATVDEKVKAVKTLPQGENVPFIQEGNKIKLQLPPVRNYQLFGLEY